MFKVPTLSINLSTSVADLAISHYIDVLALTETWLGIDIDKHVVSQLVPIGYNFHAVSRCKEKRGGGVVMWTSTHCFDFFHVILCIVSIWPPKQKSWLRRCRSPLNSSSLFVSDEKILNMNGERQFRNGIFLLINL